MVTEEMLCAAAARSCEIYVAYLERGYDPENQHEFSLQFEKKIKKLKRKADHPVFYHTTKRIASIVLAILISGGVWLAVDIEARAAFFGWIKEVYESYFVYRFEDDAVSNINPSSYRPTWLPSGYTEFYVDETENTVAIVYADEEGRMLKLNYIQNPNETDWFVKTEQVEIESATINGKPAELFISKDSETANAIIWTSDDNTAFYLSAFLSKADLIKVAESVQVIE